MKFRNYSNKKKDILNPLSYRCINLKCRKRLKLKNFYFLKGLRGFPASIAYENLQLFINEGLNACKIKSIIDNKRYKEIHISKTHKISLYFRMIIYEYMKKNIVKH